MKRPSLPSRRALLRGLGVSMALPWLEAGHLLAEEPKKVSQGGDGPPRRFGALFISNGVMPEKWWATGQGKEMKLGPSLQPLAPYKDQLTVIKGLYNPESGHGEQHMASTSNILSGARVKRTLTKPEVATSVDQLMVPIIGSDSAVPSLVLGTEGMNFGNFGNAYTMMYSSCISWANATTPISQEAYPRQAFDRLFGDPGGSRQDRSILDAVRLDAKRIHGVISQADRHRLDQYFEAIRNVEVRMDRQEQQSDQAFAFDPQQYRPPAGLPDQIPDHMRLMLDIIALAFQCDRTRVVTYMFNNDISGMDFSFIGVKGRLHIVSHNGGEPYAKTNLFHVEQVAYLIKRLADVREGDGNLLDYCSLLVTSSFMDGGKHDRTANPMLLLGGGGKAWPLGRTYDFSGRADRQLTRLYLRILQAHDPSVQQMLDYNQALVL